MAEAHYEEMKNKMRVHRRESGQSCDLGWYLETKSLFKKLLKVKQESFSGTLNDFNERVTGTSDNSTWFEPSDV